MQAVIENVWSFSGLIAGRVYLIQDPDGLTLVDTGIKPAGAKILSQLAEAGHAPSDVKRILLTHVHPDHAGGLHDVQKATGAEVYVSTLEAPTLRGEEPVPTPNRRIRPPKIMYPATPVAHMLNDGDSIPEVLGGLHAIHTPGHSRGHMVFWSPSRKIAFIGDVFFHMMGITMPLGFVTEDMAQNKQSAHKIIALGAETVCFGHGQPLSSGATATLQARAKAKGW
jgi:glyoxylase-like metal-dependent hydrolase (beta-lactamase superfamily II)